MSRLHSSPFTAETTAAEMARMAEGARNTRDPP
jgi:nuclear transport factor 2 (NTF2) superfamily protein